MIETGTVLQQRYRIDKQIGQGGMGAVYVATDERFGSTVAIKETLFMDDSFRKAIEREARLLNSLKHSALPRVSDHFEENNGQFLVMEFIPGEDVAAMLEGSAGPFPVDRVLKWADELLDALDYLHNQDMPVIHRDIKPQNLKVNSRGEIILLDFGLAKGNPTDASHQTAAKSIFGYSRSYASIEQIQGTGTDPRSDLYSLAATLYHLLTKVAPEDALTRAMAVLAQKPDPLAAANSINPAVPRGVAGVLQKALALNASDRPASASEMRQMFRESENYGYLADEAAISGRISDPKVFSQPTKLMSDATRAEASLETGAKTEVLPGAVSRETALRVAVASEQKTNVIPINVTSAPVAKGRGFGMAAGALMMLLVGGAVAGGIYVVKPSVFGVESSVEKGADPGAAVPVVSDTVPAANANTSSIQVGSASGSVPTSLNTAAPEVTHQPTVEKPTEVTKNTKSTVATKPKNGGDVGETMTFTDDDPDIPPQGITVTRPDKNGRMTTIHVNPSKPRQGPPPGFDPFPPGVDMGNLSPAQRRKLQQVFRRNGIRPPKPDPQGTPDQNR